MANLRINDLNDLYTGGTLKAGNAYNSIFKSGYQNQLTTLFTTDINNNGQDYIPVDHYANGIYTTKKMSIAAYEKVMYGIRLKAISSDIFSSLPLGDLSSWNYSELNLSALAHLSAVTPSQIDCTSEKIPTNKIDTTFGRLHSKNYIVNADVANNANISYTKIAGLKNLATMSLADLNLGDLSSKNEIQLGLSSLSHKRYVNLSRHVTYEALTAYDGSSEDAPVVGYLHWNHISGAPNIPALELAESDKFGCVKTGFAESVTGKPRQYALQIEPSTGKAFVRVPWVDHETRITAFNTTNGTNGFNIEISGYVKRYDTDGREYTTNFGGKRDVTVTPRITNNVIANSFPTTEDAINATENTIPLFAANSTTNPNAIKIKPSGIKIKTNSADPKFLKENGNWEIIANATTSIDGLLTKEDFSFIHSLRAKNDVFYTLPTASTSAKGGIKLARQPDKIYNNFTTYGSNAIHLPVQLTQNSDVAYVDIPDTVGNTSTLTATIANKANDAVKDMVQSLYPVGAIYITAAETDTCPIQSLIAGWTWEKITGKYLLASGQIYGTVGAADRFTASSLVSAGLPQHTHNVGVGVGDCSCGRLNSIKNTHQSTSQYFTSTNASGAIYGASETVRPPAFVVSVFKRTK